MSILDRNLIFCFMIPAIAIETEERCPIRKMRKEVLRFDFGLLRVFPRKEFVAAPRCKRRKESERLKGTFFVFS